MVLHRMDKDTFNFWVERRIKEAYVRGKIKDLSKGSYDVSGASPIHSSFWTVFKNGVRSI